MNYDPTFIPYHSMRYPIYASHGMVAASSPQASAAGLDIMRHGGNAVDAAVATAAALTVVEPTANGIGSDAFALVWIEKDQRLYGLNGSGWAPMTLTLAAAREASVNGKMPTHGWTPTMVPGAPGAWAALSSRFGRLPLSRTLAPAIEYARDGYPASPNLARAWSGSIDHFTRNLKGPEYAEWFNTFASDGELHAGSRVCLLNHARTLELIGESNAEAFYRGELAERIVEDSNEFGGFFSNEDFSDYAPSWVEPISVHYRGYDVCEIPPNGQGIVALMALNILKEFMFTHRESSDAFHTQWEAMKIAFADGLGHVTDPKAMRVSYDDLIKPSYGALRAGEIGPSAKSYTAALPPKSGTVYFCAADGEGNMVSMIQSNYMGFGSGIVVRGTGISLQNRGHDFSLDPSDVNCVAPRKKTYHTIIPGFLMKDGKAVGPFGVMGGYMQPQGHVQVVTNLIDYHMNPQQALDAPRWQWMRDDRMTVESSFNPEIASQLVRRGHKVDVTLNHTAFGRGQIILRSEDDALVGATEGRTDSNIACW
ncbi:gamma-glutamyltransferase [Clostridia bacterium]|nr:gamma-glutamyltransferase [Clostridia bacterium]